MPASSSLEIKQNIENSIRSFSRETLLTASTKALNSLGYGSEKVLRIAPNNFSGFKQVFDTTKNNFNAEKACVELWNQIEIIFQLGSDDISPESGLFNSNRVDDKIIESFLFIAIELKGDNHNRTTLAKITREVNKLTSMPAVIFFKYGRFLTLAIIDRRLHKKDESKDVLQKVTLIKDVNTDNPHRAHIEILFDLSFYELQRKESVSNFVSLHSAWQKTLDTKELNKKFYEKLFNWYLWALKQVKFPQIRPEKDMLKDEIHQSESLIRLLTRLLFVWFMKEKGLINPILFDCNKLQSVLKNFEGISGDDTIYYKAILQNLFFATLNKPIEQRKVIDKGFNPKEYGDPLVYRYDELFQDSKNFIKLFENIPFLNGGLFECLDQRKDKDNPVEIRLDGFSTKKSKQPIVPDKLFFGEYKNIDLSEDYYDKKKSKQTVFGLIDILNQYKFTIEENTPIEEEIALDPELLGKVFENLLASYNPETKTTARKQTGSFYTPREIVNYMVDESIIAYLKNHIDDEERLRKLLSYNTSEMENPFNEEETLILLKAIDSCKILDPACGSGAFPMGILQKMIFVLHKLDPENKLWFDMVVENIPVYIREEFRKRLSKESWNYVRKLGIIQQCIYGVDIQPIATQIAKLRFFISLLVDQTEMPDEPNRGFEPLPNLDFKIVTANTLIFAPASDIKIEGLFEEQTDPFFEQFDNLTEKYFNTSIEEEKKALRKQITDFINNKCNEKITELEKSYASEYEQIEKALKEKNKEFIAAKENEIKLWLSYPNIFKHESVGFFEPRYFFPKVKEGFDIVIGNPPYITYKGKEVVDISDEEVKQLIELYPNSAEYKVNSYALFTERGVNLLSVNGTLSYIIPSTILQNEYLKKIRKYLITKYHISQIVSFANKVFEAVTDSIILFINNKHSKDLIAAALRKLDLDFSNLEDKKTYSQSIWEDDKNDYVINLKTNQKEDCILAKIKDNCKYVEDYLEVNIGIKRTNTPLIDKPKQGYKPFLVGRDINKLELNFAGKYILFDTSLFHTTIDEGIFKQKEKILVRKTGNILIAYYDTEKYYTDQSIYNLYPKRGKTINLKVVTGLLNSNLLEYFFNKKMITNPDVFPYIKGIHLKKLPLKFPKSKADELKFESLVLKISEMKRNGEDTTTELIKLNQMVYKLYDLTYEEVKIIDGEIEKIISKEEYEKKENN